VHKTVNDDIGHFRFQRQNQKILYSVCSSMLLLNFVFRIVYKICLLSRLIHQLFSFDEFSTMPCCRQVTRPESEWYVTWLVDSEVC